METVGPLRINPSTLDYDLPAELIAQEPLKNREQAKLLVIHRATAALEHRVFSDIVSYLRKGDVLVVNKARVSPAKLLGKKPTGGKVEIICVAPAGDRFTWTALVRPELKVGATFLIEDTPVTLVRKAENGENVLRFDGTAPDDLMARAGALPLPPYIKRAPGDPRSTEDAADYQTVYASAPGSLAAPTAGLHFSNDLLDRLRSSGVQVEQIHLQVGWGTFKPISTSVALHAMLGERYDVDPSVWGRLKKARHENRRIIGVGTTVTRVLESLSPDGPDPDLTGETNLFIKPGFRFKWLSGLITNFHVPRSTPISLTAAFVGLQTLERAYAEAIERRYRFYSYGDAMLIL